MLWRALAVWVGILVCAIANGALRDVVLSSYMRHVTARAVSSVVLAAVVVGITVATLKWIAPSSLPHAVAVGVFWLVLTLSFEFLFGHFVAGKPWVLLLDDYNVLRGRLWILVIIATLLAPPWAYAR